MVLKVFLSGDFARWNVELPKERIEVGWWVWGENCDAGWLGEMRAES